MQKVIANIGLLQLAQCNATVYEEYILFPGKKFAVDFLLVYLVVKAIIVFKENFPNTDEYIENVFMFRFLS